ncbi:histidinol-phosphate transaminase [Dokdonia sinensis]|uniref:Histidinol-phosphate aminotransferase n=1 Tax=Dokdonia sinensis TaxID=2479847 RepID=A0A3M0FXB2_9FLAO|nr:histidinol-phosphate transaminase [Dokdonia sinensis]RMB57341.1 histidinol-phosphate transaminase [Dokdonia sinensis]
MKKQFNLKNLIRPNVARMKPYSSARDEFTDFDQEMVFLDANENPFENGVNRYPDPKQGDLKALIASQKGVTTQQILAGNGSDEVLDLLFRAFCNPGRDNVISLPPTYGMYGVLCATNDIENREVLLNEQFQPNISAIFKEVDAHTKMIFICSPNNPTGNLISAQVITEILELFSGLVVIDEAYIDFAPAESWITQLSNYPNLVVTQTLSKAYGLAGIRLGLCFASEEIINVLNKIKPPYNVNKLTQVKAYERVVAVNEVNEEVNLILNNRNALLDALREVTFVTQIFASDANFVLARVDDANTRYDELIKKGIVVRNRSSQPLCENTLRFTVGTLQENQALIKALKSLS